MDNSPNPVMNRGVVAGFNARKAEKGNARQAQMDMKPMDDLFKPEKKPMDKPMDKHGPDSDVSIDLEDGMDKDIGLDKQMSFEDLKSGIENFEGPPEEMEELCDMMQDKLMGDKSDDFDTEMDRPEANMKDDMMKNDKPLGGMGIDGAQPAMPPASPTPSPMR